MPQGSLDKNLIQRPIKARSAEIRACYEHVLVARPALAGTVRAKFAIVASGKVTSVEISGFDRELDECICNEMLQLQYPQFGSARFGTITVMYPFTFRRESAAD